MAGRSSGRPARPFFTVRPPSIGNRVPCGVRLKN
jgi:hypothetical protein